MNMYFIDFKAASKRQLKFAKSINLNSVDFFLFSESYHVHVFDVLIYKTNCIVFHAFNVQM